MKIQYDIFFPNGETLSKIFNEPVVPPFGSTLQPWSGFFFEIKHIMRPLENVLSSDSATYVVGAVLKERKFTGYEPSEIQSVIAGLKSKGWQKESGDRNNWFWLKWA